MTKPFHFHAFDLRSVVLFTSLTLGGTAAVMAQTNSNPASQPQTHSAPAAPAIGTQPTTPAEIFTRYDINRDNKLSRNEAQSLPSVAEQFDAWDTDRSGDLTLDEFLLGVQQPK